MWFCFLTVTIVLSIKQAIELYIEKCKFVNSQDIVETASYLLSFIINLVNSPLSPLLAYYFPTSGIAHHHHMNIYFVD